MLIDSALARHRREFRRALANGRYEATDDGLLFPAAGAVVTGAFYHDVNGKDPRVDPNRIVTQGLNYLLNAALGGASPITAWYIAPFANNVTVPATWTAANFHANANEFTNYNEDNRGEWARGASSGGVIDNLANRALFTIGAGGGTVWGAGLLSALTKQSTTGTLVAASRFELARVLVAEDEFKIGYSLTLTSTS